MPSLASDALKYGGNINVIRGADYPVLGGISDMLYSIDTPVGKPYENLANVLSGWSFGRPSSTLDKVFAIGEALDPTSLPALLAGGAEYYRKNRSN